MKRSNAVLSLVGILSVMVLAAGAWGQEEPFIDDPISDAGQEATGTLDDPDAPPSPQLFATEVDDSDLPAGHSQHGEVFNKGPRQRAVLMSGTGPISFEVTAAHPQVQAFVEQGIGQVHGFWYFEAERSFRQAAMLDPECAIAYWGMSLANANNSSRAKQFIAEAVERLEQASPRERLFIEAQQRYLGSGSRRDKAKRLVKDYKQIIEQYPDDLEAKALLGYVLYKNRSSVGVNYDDVDKALREVLAVEPAHPVHHYRIHLWDYKKPSNSLDSAAACGPSSPAIAHMWHMPGHIYSRLKRYEDAVYQQEASARVDHAQMMRDRVMPDQIHNFAHNNEWLIRSLMYVGRWQDARDLAKNMIELPQHPSYNTTSRRGSAYYGRLRLFDVLAQFELWQDMIDCGNTHYLMPTDSTNEQIKRLRHLGVAHARLEHQAEVDEILEDLRKRLEKAGQSNTNQQQPRGRSRRRGRRGGSTRQNIERAIAAIEGHRALAAESYQTASEFLAKANEQAMVKARVQVLAGESEAGIKAAESFMRSNKKRVLPQAQYIELLWLADRGEDARKAFQELIEISSSIQLGAPAFDRLKPIAAELQLEEDWRRPLELADDIGERPDLDSLGPFRWQPSAAASFALNDINDHSYRLDDFAGKPVILVFYLGHACLHCAEQLQALAPMVEDFKEAGIEVLAISTDDKEGLAECLKAYEGKMPIPLISDAKHEVFKAYRAYDDFEQLPLHGTFVIDGEGKIVWQDISYEPFMQVDFLLKESKRLLSLGE